MDDKPCRCGGIMFGDGYAHTPACPAFEGDATPPATPQSHDPWKLIATARDTFHANGHLNPHLRAAWGMAANYLDRMLGDHPATPQPESEVMPRLQSLPASIRQHVATASADALRNDWRIISGRKWDWHDQNLIVRPFVDALLDRALSPPPDVERPDDDRQKAADEAHPSFIVTCRACGSTVVSVQSDVGYSPLSGGWGGVHLHCESCHADDAIWSMS